jgi:hypothetical protein
VRARNDREYRLKVLFYKLISRVFLKKTLCFILSRARATKTHSTIAGAMEKLKIAVAEEDMDTGFKIITAIITVVGSAGLVLYL